MKLADYMTANDLDDDAMAAKIRTRKVRCDRTQISRYRRGRRRPDWDVLERLAEVTGHKVTANDFMMLEAAE